MPSSSNIPTELGTESIGKLLKKYAIPAIIAMTASSLYNVVDSIFIGHGVGALGLSGLALSFPLMNLSTAIGTLAGVGASTMISVLLGRADTAGAKSVLGNQITLKIIISILFTIICLLFLDPILTFFGASEATLPYAREYMEVILIGNIFTHLYFGLINTVRASGNPKVSMWMTIFTVFFNALINPLFIFALDLGIKGAAIATVLSQAIALVFLIRFMYTRGGEFMKLKFKDLALDLSIVKRIFSIGISPFLLNSAACLVAIFVNQQLSKYSGDIGIAAYGIVNRITFLVVMIILGFSQGMQPIAGYNYGACKYSRMRKVYKLTAAAATYSI